MTPCYLIDSSIYIFRYYFSRTQAHQSRQGREVGTALAYFRWLLGFINKTSPEWVAACFDESLGSGFRHELNPAYKSNRSFPDEELAYQLLACKQLTSLAGIACYASETYEADDLIATLFQYAHRCGYEAVVLTRDKDLGQVLDKEKGLFWDYGYDDPIGYDSFAREFGIAPEHIPDYLAIAGDSADAITGVRGVGKKTVAALFQALGNWEAIKAGFELIPELPIRGAAGVAKKLSDAREQVDANLHLTRLRFDCLPENMCDLTRRRPDMDALITLLDEFRASPRLMAQAEALGQ